MLVVVRRHSFRSLKFCWCRSQFLTWRAISWLTYSVWLHVYQMLTVTKIINLSKRCLRFLKGRLLWQQKFSRKIKTSIYKKTKKWYPKKKCFNNWPALWPLFRLWVFFKAFCTDYYAVSMIVVKKRIVVPGNSISSWIRVSLMSAKKWICKSSFFVRDFKQQQFSPCLKVGHQQL